MNRSSRRILSLFAAFLLLCGPASGVGASSAERADELPSWRVLDTGVLNDFRGLAAVNKHVAWVSGYDGVVLRTTDGGKTWKDVSPPRAGKFEFRDIAAFGTRDAVVMGAGALRKSRLYVTHDGGRHWARTYTNRVKGVFFDCMSFSDDQRGLLMSDPVDGKFRILSTVNGGDSWTVLPTSGMPDALEDEYGFAASGECLTTLGDDAWFGTGGGAHARVFHSADGGLTWDVTGAHIRSGASSGVFGLAFASPALGVAVGGDFARPARTQRNGSWYRGGEWTRSKRLPNGYRSGVTHVPSTSTTFIAVGLTGSDISHNGGRTWQTFDHGTFDTVMCADDGSCWASGDEGRVAVLRQ